MEKILYISNAADSEELFYMFSGSEKEFIFWQDFHLNGKNIGTLGMINAIAEDFSTPQGAIVACTRPKITHLVTEGVKKGFSIFLLGASTKFMKTKLEQLFPDKIFLTGNELTAMAITLQEKFFLDPSKKVLIMGGSTDLARKNAELLRSFIPSENIFLNARGHKKDLMKKFPDSPFGLATFDDIANGFQVTQLLNSIHIPLLEKGDFIRLGIEVCIEAARPYVYRKICQDLNIQWAQLATFYHSKLIWERPVYDIGQNGFFACFLQGYLYAKFGSLNDEQLLPKAREEGFSLQYVDSVPRLL